MKRSREREKLGMLENAKRQKRRLKTRVKWSEWGVGGETRTGRKQTPTASPSDVTSLSARTCSSATASTRGDDRPWKLERSLVVAGGDSDSVTSCCAMTSGRESLCSVLAGWRLMEPMRGRARALRRSGVMPELAGVRSIAALPSNRQPRLPKN